MWVADRNPDTTVIDGAGWCLRFTSKVWNVSTSRYKSAWQAWEATTDKHTDPIPNVAVPVWFSHFGTYGDPGHETYENWGHVVTWVPGVGYLSSPLSGVGQLWLATIEEVEKKFSSKYVGWTSDIGGVTVAHYEEEISNTEEETMSVFVRPVNNSDPVPETGTSRIWAGEPRNIHGIDYSGVWQLTEPGARRLTMAEWSAVQGAYKTAKRPIALSEISGNELEVIVYAPEVP